MILCGVAWGKVKGVVGVIALREPLLQLLTVSLSDYAMKKKKTMVVSLFF